MEAPYAESLRERAEWVVHSFAAGTDARSVTQEITGRASAHLAEGVAGHG
ncbi:hypothetical protein [Streptomyces parvulus]